MADDLKIFSLESLLYFPEQIYKVYEKIIYQSSICSGESGRECYHEVKYYAILKYKKNAIYMTLSFSCNFRKFILKSPAKIK